MSAKVRWLLAGLAAVVVVVVAFFTLSPKQAETVRTPAVVTPTPSAEETALPEPEPTVEPEPVPLPEPLEPMTEPEPETVVETEPELFDFELPPLDDSDETLLGALKTKIAQESLDLLVDEGLIEHFVITASAIATDDLAYKMLPVERPGGSFKVIEAQGNYYASTANLARYQPYLDLIAAMPRDYWLDYYDHVYPLLQQAYERLGYPPQSFHDVLIQAIEKTLATSAPSSAMAMNQPNVMYQYADETRQQASDLQKLMWRLGPDTNVRLRGLLRGLLQGLKNKQPE